MDLEEGSDSKAGKKRTPELGTFVAKHGTVEGVEVCRVQKSSTRLKDRRRRRGGKEGESDWMRVDSDPFEFGEGGTFRKGQR